MVKKESKQPQQQMVETWKGFFKPFNVFLSILVICTLVLVILNWKHYYHELLESQGAVVTTEKPRVSLKPIRLDMARFEIEVLKPHKDMKKKFPNHPDMVINKLSKYLRKEENK